MAVALIHRTAEPLDGALKQGCDAPAAVINKMHQEQSRRSRIGAKTRKVFCSNKNPWSE
jgi:hypothetical protein